MPEDSKQPQCQGRSRNDKDRNNNDRSHRVGEVIGEGGEGFGFGARIDGDTIVTAAAHGDRASTFWIFMRATDGWRGTPLAIDGQDSRNDWVVGIDVHGSEVAVSTFDALWMGTIQPPAE